jgi:mRNA-degrading endonuclease HigB of HigAB toxin-antitoxin module
MVVVGRDILSKFAAGEPEASVGVALWTAIAVRAAWSCPADVAATFPSCNFIGPKIAVFVLSQCGCKVTAQIAFNSGVVIVLAAVRGHGSSDVI